MANTTGRVRRRDPAIPLPDYSYAEQSSFIRGIVTPSEPRPAEPVCPQGDLSRVPAAGILEVVAAVWPSPGDNVENRCRALRTVLGRLAAIPGDTWQQRWDAARDSESYFAGADAADGIAYKLLLSLRVIRMDLYTVRMLSPQHYAELFRRAQADLALDRYFDHVQAMSVTREYQLGALFDMACLLTVYGIRFAEVTPSGLLYYAWECRRLGVGTRKRNLPGRFSGHVAWVALSELGHFPPDTPTTLLAAAKPGRLTVAEMVDRYGVAPAAVRQLLIDYLQRRAADMDYSSVVSLARACQKDCVTVLTGLTS